MDRSGQPAWAGIGGSGGPCHAGVCRWYRRVKLPNSGAAIDAQPRSAQKADKSGRGGLQRRQDASTGAVDGDKSSGDGRAYMTENTSETLWYIARDGQQHGPISDTEMRLFVENGHLKPTDLLWQPGFTDWRPASDVFPAPVAPVPPDAGTTAAAEAGANAPEPTRAPNGPSATGASTPSQGPERDAGSRSPAGSAGAGGGAAATAARPGSAASSARPAQGVRGGSGATHWPAPPQESAGSGPSHQSAHRASGPGMGAAGPAAEARPYQPAMAGGAVTAAVQAEETPKPRSGSVKYAVAALLFALIGGSLLFLVTHKNDIMAMMGADGASENVPVVKAAPETRTPPQQTAALQTPKPAQPPESPGLPDAAVQNGAAGQPAAPAVQPPEVTAAPRDVAPEPAPSGDAAATQATVTPTATPPVADASGFDAYYQKSKLWQYMKNAYPDWYAQRMREVAPLGSGSQPPLDATKSLVQGLVALRRQHANEALQADTDRLKSIAQAFLDNLQALSETGAEACYGFISQGETSTKSVDLFHRPQSAPALEQQALTIFEAIAAGTASPAKHDRPKKGDYDVLAAELGKLGWSQSDLQLFADPKALSNAPPARVCQMVRDWFKAHIAISDTSVQERLLFETLRPVVSG